jgi:hypothetical protein
MTREKITLTGLLGFAAVVAVFLVFGARVGWRVAGGIGLWEALSALRVGRVGIGIEGYEPAYFLTGRAAAMVALVGARFSLAVMVEPGWLIGAAK